MKFQYKDIKMNIHEDICGFPEVQIDIDGIFLSPSHHITSIDTQKMKEQIALAIKNSFSFEEVETYECDESK